MKGLPKAITKERLYKKLSNMVFADKDMSEKVVVWSEKQVKQFITDFFPPITASHWLYKNMLEKRSGILFEKVRK